MSKKIEEGDWVKTVEAHDYLDLSANEIGQVVGVEASANGASYLTVAFTASDGSFTYQLGVAESDVEKVGTRIKKTKVSKIKYGDILVLDGEHEDNLKHAEGYRFLGEWDTNHDGSLDFYVWDSVNAEDYQVRVPADERDKKVWVIR